MSNKKLVFIYSIPRPSAQKLDEFTADSSGVKIKKNKNGEAKDSLAALKNTRTSKLSTGLDEPWLENGAQKEENGRLLTLQDKYERQFNLDRGFLTDECSPGLDKFYQTNHVPTYFQSKSWSLNDGATVLDLDVFDDCMFYHVCLASKLVANSEREWKEHKWPHARYYVAIENEQDEIKFKSNTNKIAAFAALSDSDMLPTVKRKIAAILELVNVKGNVTEEQVTNLLFQFIENNTSNNNNIYRFLTLYKLLKTADGKIQFEARFTLKQALDMRIISINKGTYTWVRAKGSIELGNKPESALEFLMDTKKADLIQELQSEIKLKS